jgi:CubicO group peptidase (beta-lactamase class C family)
LLSILGADGIIDKVPAAHKITIEDLFRHTSGLGYGGGGRTSVHKMYPLTSTSAAQVMTGSEFIDRLSSLPLMSEPGMAWEYGFGLDLLGLVIESISHERLGQYLTKNVWKPLGMTDTSFIIPAEKMPFYAKSLPIDPETDRPQPPRPLVNKFDCGGGCAVSTAGDYLRFAWKLVNKGTFGHVRLLDRKTVEYMLSDRLGPDISRLLKKSLKSVHEGM